MGEPTQRFRGQRRPASVVEPLTTDETLRVKLEHAIRNTLTTLLIEQFMEGPGIDAYGTGAGNIAPRSTAAPLNLQPNMPGNLHTVNPPTVPRTVPNRPLSWWERPTTPPAPYPPETPRTTAPRTMPPSWTPRTPGPQLPTRPVVQLSPQGPIRPAPNPALRVIGAPVAAAGLAGLAGGTAAVESGAAEFVPGASNYTLADPAGWSGAVDLVSYPFEEVYSWLNEEAKQSDKEVYGVDTTSPLPAGGKDIGKVSCVPGEPVSDEMLKSEILRFKKLAGIMSEQEEMDMTAAMQDLPDLEDVQVDPENMDIPGAEDMGDAVTGELDMEDIPELQPNMEDPELPDMEDIEIPRGTETLNIPEPFEP